MVTLSDDLLQDVIHDAHAGNANAFRILYEQYVGMVFHTAFLMLGDYHQAEELTQDVFVQVSRKLGLYTRERGAFSTWLHKVTINMCINATKRSWIHWLSLDRASDAGMIPPAHQGQPLDTVLANEECTRVSAAIAGLSVKLRAVVILRYYANLSYDEIAAVIDCPVGTVRSRLAAAHTQLHTKLENRHE